MSTLYSAVLDQNPIEFKAKFDEAVQAAILRQSAEIQSQIVSVYSESVSRKDGEDLLDGEGAADESTNTPDTNKEKDADSDGSKSDDESGEDADKEADKEAGDKSDDESGEDADKEADEEVKESEELTERVLSFEIGNPSAASKQLRGKGIASATDPDNGKIIKVKVATPDDGRKVTAWLLDQGWSEKEVKRKYPELSRLAKAKG